MMENVQKSQHFFSPVIPFSHVAFRQPDQGADDNGESNDPFTANKTWKTVRKATLAGAGRQHSVMTVNDRRLNDWKSDTSWTAGPGSSSPSTVRFSDRSDVRTSFRTRADTFSGTSDLEPATGETIERRQSFPSKKLCLTNGSASVSSSPRVQSLPRLKKRLDEMRMAAMSMPQLPIAVSTDSLSFSEDECHCPACCNCRSLSSLNASQESVNVAAGKTTTAAAAVVTAAAIGSLSVGSKRKCLLRQTLNDVERREGGSGGGSGGGGKAGVKKVKKAGVTKRNSGLTVKYKMEKMLEWFEELDDQQRNVFLQKIIDQCHCAQLHFLSIAMGDNLHRFCPHNCQDILSWLPPAISHHILSYLSPDDLCHCSQVSIAWNVMASNELLWELLSRRKEWQFSEKGERRQLREYDNSDHVQWKLMFSERYRIRRNWLKGRYSVRTFEGHSQGISCVQFDEQKIVSGSSDKTIKVWDIHTNKPWSALTLAGHSATVRCLQLHGDSRLVSGSADQTIKVWDLTNTGGDWSCAACRATMVGHLHTVRCLQVDDTKVISGSYDKTLKVWNMMDGQCQMTLRGHDEAVLCLQYDSDKIVSGSADKKIKIWDLEGGKCIHTLSGHHEAVTCLHFDETRIISGSVDSGIKFWDIRTNECIGTLDWIRSEGHTGVVRHLQADKWRVVSAADDKTLKVWSIETGQRLLTLRCHSDGVTCLQFNDWMMVSGSYDKTVKLYDFSVC
eukprot:m.21743 g.21743  ORF g.21743 m.21743 type:complete len:730 (+) comp28214_c0_seq1:139-2328(+)